jgi:hypothetical protein
MNAEWLCASRVRPCACQRASRAALRGFVSLEATDGFPIALDLDDSFQRLVAVLDHGLSTTSRA